MIFWSRTVKVTGILRLAVWSGSAKTGQLGHFDAFECQIYEIV